MSRRPPYRPYLAITGSPTRALQLLEEYTDCVAVEHLAAYFVPGTPGCWWAIMQRFEVDPECPSE